MMVPTASERGCDISRLCAVSSQIVSRVSWVPAHLDACWRRETETQVSRVLAVG
jgi:hypothetical protein